MEELRFNHRAMFYTMFIEGRPVLHMVDERSHFQAAGFLRMQSTANIWKGIQKLWIFTYLGPPDFLALDQGSAYVSKYMKSIMAAAGISLEEAPIDNPALLL